MKHTLTIHAYISDYQLKWLKPEDLQTDKVVRALGFSVHGSMPGVVYVGHAEVEVEIIPTDKIIEGAVEMLRNQQIELRAKSTAECTKLEGHIQQLLCIENKPTEGV